MPKSPLLPTSMPAPAAQVGPWLLAGGGLIGLVIAILTFVRRRGRHPR
jgi:hypothetical protein